jgi:hypothetical protein
MIEDPVQVEAGKIRQRRDPLSLGFDVLFFEQDPYTT